MSSTTLTAEQRSIRARVGAYALHAQGGTNTGPATAARMARYDQRVREAAAARGETITPEELARRSVFLRRAHMARLALRSSIVRRKKSAAAIVSPAALVSEAHADAPIPTS